MARSTSDSPHAGLDTSPDLRVEHLLTLLRWFAVLWGVAAIAVGSVPAGDEVRAWTLIVAVTLGNLLLWGLSGRVTYPSHGARLSLASFIFDVGIVAAFTWLFASPETGSTGVVLLLLPLEGAFRYRLRGALFGAGSVAAISAVQQWGLGNGGMDPSVTDFLWITGTASALALVAGGVIESWHTRLETASAQAQQLREFDDMKDRFLAVTSHEIRGPVTAIIAGVDTVRRKSDRLSQEQVQKLLTMVAQQGAQLARLVDDLLVTSQLQTGKLALHTEWVGLQETVSHALEGAEGKRRGHHLEVFVEPLRCEIDAARIGQIVRNLVENAFKYSPEGASVTVTGKAYEGGIVIGVSDTGGGIPESKRSQLFDAFSRIEETAAGREGVGLGLYVVSHLTSAMGGQIDLQSSSQGTEFSIRIPCSSEPEGRPSLNLVEGGS